ncbi:hypothetical protein D9M72_358140 [compost metagenome]
MHAQGPTLFVIGYCLNHRSEDVGIDLLPIQFAGAQKVGAGCAGELRHVGAAREQAAVYVGERFGPAWHLGCGALLPRDVHGAKDSFKHLVGVRSVAFGHLLQRSGEQGRARENIGVLGEEAKHQASHEVIHVRPALVSGPGLVVLQQLDVKLVQAPGRADIDRAVLDFLDGGNTRKRQEKAKVVGELRELAGQGLAAGQVFGFKRLSVGGQEEFGLRLLGLRAGPQRL